MNRCLAIVCATHLLVAAAFAQDKPPAELGLPWGVTRLVSPDGSRALFGLPYLKGVKNAPLVELWIENTHTKQQQMVMSTGGTLSAFWSPDGTAFVVSPGISDQAQAYIYDAVTLNRVDLGAEIMAADRSSSRFVPGEAHSYFTPERWESNSEVIVRLHGHTDSPPVQCFSAFYRVGRAGKVEKLSESVSPINPKNLCQP